MSTDSALVEPGALEELSALHLDWLERFDRSPVTLRIYRLYEHGFLRWLAGRGLPAIVAQLTPALVLEWATSRGAGAALAIWSRWLHDHAVLPCDPLADLVLPAARRRPNTGRLASPRRRQARPREPVLYAWGVADRPTPGRRATPSVRAEAPDVVCLACGRSRASRWDRSCPACGGAWIASS